MRKWIFIGIALLIASGVTLYLVLSPGLKDKIVIPYISHMKPFVDPHLPHANLVSDKLDEVVFDGIFNVSADASGLTYEDGLGELVGVEQPGNIVRIKLKTGKKWSDSYKVLMDEDEVKSIGDSTLHGFTVDDLNFTINRILKLGTLSPDYILITQALDDINFEGPDGDGIVSFDFRDDREWPDADIKEVLSFKVLPANANINALNYTVGTSDYLSVPSISGVNNYHKSPAGKAAISSFMLAPFIDNSTFTTELLNNKINVLLGTPFGAVSPLVQEDEDYFYKASLAQTFFAILFNTQSMDIENRRAVRNLINNKKIMDRLYKRGTQQQREIVDFKGNKNKYDDYLNFSVFPSTSYYVEENVIYKQEMTDDSRLTKDTVRIAVVLNYGFREELSEILEILNDKALTGGRVKAVSVQNEDVARGNYDAVLLAVNGYRSNFMFDLYDVFFREPNFDYYKINLKTRIKDGKEVFDPGSLNSSNNFCRISSEMGKDYSEFIENVHGFMSARKLGDKLVYAERVHAAEQELCLGVWLFSMPSLSYFNKQFDPASIKMYSSPLSGIENWKEVKK